jgi:hypothetical protein
MIEIVAISVLAITCIIKGKKILLKKKLIIAHFEVGVFFSTELRPTSKDASNNL